MRQRRELGAQHLVRAQCRHLLFELVRGMDPVGPHAGDDVVVDMLEIAQLLVEMTGQQQRAVVELALGDLERPLAILQGEIAGPEHDRDHKHGGAQDEPLDRAQFHPRQRTGKCPPRASRNQISR